ncbi:uncharacterized protein BT62DRAFT_85992 [Guyanagaster necrorhizus]|uniref:Uncharacterized protein n=1 Tax=Guyanagaster necrorhizus TaxID=856835 RepID=A0A9P7VSR1_9AGAR|nr:uncharacterized protein BT62DRAFT_85992 [Guyanagaster necrorhizus MCA 3950]KAG7446776.1 hypothetical protein BT62DRAFT_85992 [Guyanagaster necrorhizus MCA 3950]
MIASTLLGALCCHCRWLVFNTSNTHWTNCHILIDSPFLSKPKHCHLANPMTPVTYENVIWMLDNYKHDPDMRGYGRRTTDSLDGQKPKESSTKEKTKKSSSSSGQKPEKSDPERHSHDQTQDSLKSLVNPRQNRHQRV